MKTKHLWLSTEDQETVAVKINTPDLLEIVNECSPEKGDPPTLLIEFGTWKTETGNQTGIAVEVFGDQAPLLGPGEARRLSKWLLQAAERMDGSRGPARRGQKKRRHDEDDE